MLLSVLLLGVSALPSLIHQPAPPVLATNPIIWADVPDMSMIRVGDTYYMSSTTMHMSPGLPIMKSKDLVHWKMASYAYETLEDTDALNLENGKNAYAHGTWASSLRFHNGVFYVSSFSFTTGKTYVFSTKNPSKTPWNKASFTPVMHDHSLVFDSDGKTYMANGGGNIKLTELKPDLSGPLPGGFDQKIAPTGGKPNERPRMLVEGSQMFIVNGKYYLCNITWPRGDVRTEIVHRADKITGPYEGRVMFHDRGIAQGGMVDTPGGRWFAYLFQDHGAVGRIPWIIPMKWEDGWPVVGIDGKAPAQLDIVDKRPGIPEIVASDEFSRKSLSLVWQWNHNPDARNWSLSAHPGWLRLTTGRVDTELTRARNTLTQRTFGPLSSATTCVSVSAMKDGDTAGLVALQYRYGFVGVKKEDGARKIVMVSAQNVKPVELATVPLQQSKVFLRVDCDFRDQQDKAYFYYSLDGKKWAPIGESLNMRYDLQHFVGYRFGLFNFATQTAGGFADFDYFHIGNKLVHDEGVKR